MSGVPMGKGGLLNNRGFTLLEMLISLSIFCMIISFFPIIFQFLKGVNQFPPYDVEVFFQQVSREIREAKDINVLGDTLTLTFDDGNYVLYEPYDTSIRRRLNGRGHEVLLMDVHAIYYEKYTNGIIIRVEKGNGSIVERKLSQAPIPWVHFSEVTIS